jgi:diketogulonate reductase-like aldo/keto reductase
MIKILKFFRRRRLLIYFLFEKDNYTLGDTDYLETWEGMEECKKLGLAKSIGVSNFNEKQIQRIIDHSKVKPAALEIEVRSVD